MFRTHRSRKPKVITPVQSFSHNTNFGRKTVKTDPISRAWTESAGLFDTQKSRVDKWTQELLDQWYEKRSVVYGFNNRDLKHVCTLECAKEGSIECIFPGTNVYGCLTSGAYHVCHSNPDCHRSSFANGDSIIICIFSMKESGVVIQTNPYSQSEKGGMGDTEEADFGDSCDYAEEPEPLLIPTGYHTNKTENLKRKASSMDKVVDNSVEADFDDNDPLVDMIEGELPDDFTASTEPEDTHKKPSIKLKELVLESPSQVETGERKPKRRKCFSDANQASLYSDASQIIADLLYNETQRQAINDKIEAEMTRTTKYALRKYYKECGDAKIRPHISQVDKLIDINLNLKRLLRVLPLDRKKQSAYADMCVRLWNRIIKTPYFESNQSGFHFRHHVLGTLYLMGNAGMRTKDGSSYIIPVDQYLYENLPSQSNLHCIIPTNRSFKQYEKKNITKGRNNIKHSLNSADEAACKAVFMEMSQCITVNQ